MKQQQNQGKRFQHPQYAFDPRKRGTYNQQYENGYGGVLSDEELYSKPIDFSTKANPRKVLKKRRSSNFPSLVLPSFSVLPVAANDQWDDLETSNVFAIAARRALYPKAVDAAPSAPANPEVALSSSASSSGESKSSSSSSKQSRKRSRKASEREEGEITFDDDLSSMETDGREVASKGVGTKANVVSSESFGSSSGVSTGSRPDVDVITLDGAFPKRDHNVANVSLPVIELSDNDDEDEGILASDEDDVICVGEFASPARKKLRGAIRVPAAAYDPPQPSPFIFDKLPSVAFRPIIPYMDNLSYHMWHRHKVHLREWQAMTADHSLLFNPNNFRFVTYNILCQTAMDLHPHLYTHLAPPLQSWDYRCPQLLAEFRRLQADVMCLQEVNMVHYESDMRPVLTGELRLKDVCHWRPPKPDGCVTLFNPDKFEYVSQYNLDMNYKVELLNDVNIATFVRLKNKLNGMTIVVVNTHLVFNPRRGDVKLNQIGLILARLHKFRLGKNEPCIFAGDFNLHPGSHLYRFLVSAELDAARIQNFNPKYSSGQIDPRPFDRVLPFRGSLALPEKTHVGHNCTFQPPSWTHCDTKRLTHTFKFAPAYQVNCSLAPQVEAQMRDYVSTYHMDFGAPDHIFYTILDKSYPNSYLQVREQNLRLVRRLNLPNIRQLKRYSGPLPNDYCGSDHVPLVVEFNFS
uniref:Endo/exonuclease/phosphatase domain-containing protein n=1 Tax=Panagrellus redivivus TaxID=6233 RepID=A0A7E4VC33_PANRE